MKLLFRSGGYSFAMYTFYSTKARENLIPFSGESLPNPIVNGN